MREYIITNNNNNTLGVLYIVLGQFGTYFVPNVGIGRAPRAYLRSTINPRFGPFRGRRCARAFVRPVFHRILFATLEVGTECRQTCQICR